MDQKINAKDTIHSVRQFTLKVNDEVKAFAGAFTAPAARFATLSVS